MISPSVQGPGLRGALKSSPVKTLLCRLVKQCCNGRFSEQWLSRQDPGIFPSWLAYQNPLISWIKREYPIVTVEGAKKADPQFAVAAAGNRSGPAFRGGDGAIDFAAVIGHPHQITVKPVSSLSVTGTDFLESIGKPGNFVPGSHVAFEIYGFNGRQRLYRVVGATRQAAGKGKQR